ncbi:Uu.00g053030.m01.CDS01 [Anthostomella pinea]|uniref:Uu.00g053030.m01.CDS01 n=1 Tax=Anthostomella pinea TaxID=933095 RepID=A0AAI8YPG3_9PEZI|nr:Uu.00g053030.m01.CDS01 [Anthostomella pinea]
MATNKRSPTPDNLAAEDPDTAATRKELRQTAISERPNLSAMAATDPDPKASAPKTASSEDKAPGEASTPDRESAEAPSDSVKEQVASPKKKRAHDEVDEQRDSTAGTNGDVSPLPANGSALSRTNRSEPEKKRPRDVSSESKADTAAPATLSDSKETPKTGDKEGESAIEKSTETASEKDEKVTSETAFKSSGISGFATQSSPFLQAGGTKPLSSFASASGSQSPFGLTSSASSTGSVFGQGASSSLANGSSSPFGQMGGSSKPFGSSALGGTFGSSVGGSKLSNFGKPGESFKSSKPARPFGAPVSEEEDNDDGDEEGTSDNDKEDNENKDGEDEKSVVGDDKKKTKLQRVAVDDGEAGEVTIFQARAKLYNLDKASSAWKERGAGNLKINVPIPCVDINEDTGGPIPGSFDASTLEDSEPKVVRLIMRQDSTHRVILNTVLIPAMKFQEKSTVKATCVLFTAIEDGGAVSIQMKMSPANAKSFLNEVGKVQRELQSAATKAAPSAPKAPQEPPRILRDYLTASISRDDDGGEPSNEIDSHNSSPRSPGSPGSAAKRKADKDEVKDSAMRTSKRNRASSSF